MNQVTDCTRCIGVEVEARDYRRWERVRRPEESEAPGRRIKKEGKSDENVCKRVKTEETRKKG